MKAWKESTHNIIPFYQDTEEKIKILSVMFMLTLAIVLT